ncbi:DinB family protein [Nocardia aurantiaca]|uniref:DinB family protein n=1 Tax=Nocardia aurantiaca TaxID=2675850 RepID=A0A6I3L6W7_9NOCA|nr:DinB family protein [Nocardia aurantiaca]MTE16186.1 DinB family protein [Nocardia aurantiaca]
MPIVPDTKDWTWVLERACADCGFDPDATAYEAVPGSLRDSAARISAALERPDARQRPDDATWSPLEYAAHARDVCRIFTHRLDIARTGGPRPGPMIAAYDTAVTMGDNGIPMFANWDQDATAVAANYAAAETATVAAELAAAVDTVAHAFASVPIAERDRAALRGNGSAFTVDSMALYFLHDLVHHAHDVER